MTPVADRLADRVRGFRQDNGWSRAALADLADLHATTVWNVERGQGAHVATVDALARALGVTPGALLDEEARVLTKEASRITNPGKSPQVGIPTGFGKGSASPSSQFR